MSLPSIWERCDTVDHLIAMLADGRPLPYGTGETAAQTLARWADGKYRGVHAGHEVVAKYAQLRAREVLDPATGECLT